MATRPSTVIVAPVNIPFDKTYAQLPERFFARQQPGRVPEPTLVRLNLGLAATLSIDPDWLTSADGVAMLAGNAMPEGAEPIAQAYAGHQFGGFVSQLGDGRALLLGEVVGTDGLRRDVQLKGARSATCRPRWSCTRTLRSSACATARGCASADRRSLGGVLVCGITSLHS